MASPLSLRCDGSIPSLRSGYLMALPILRISKMKQSGRSSPGAVMGHLARSRPTPNADTQRTPSNQWIVGRDDMDLGAAIDAAHKRYGVTPRADSTIANDLLLTISPDFFRDDPNAHGTWREDRLKVFQAEATAFLRKTFGSRLVAAVLHLDEATPHIQAVVVPVMPHKTEEGRFRLSGKDMFGPEALHALQQAWEDRLTSHGVSPRQVGSKTRHVTLREYYGSIEEFADHDPRKAIKLETPPVRGRIEAVEAYEARTAAWKKGEEKRLRKEMRGLAADASRGRLFDRERRSRSEVVGKLQSASIALRGAKEALTEASAELDLSKEQIAELRRTPINAIAARLEWDGPIPKKANAIDLVKAAGDLDYNQAVAWLAQNFGPAIATTAVREVTVRDMTRHVDGPKVWTKSEQTKRRIVAEQLDALAAPAYRLTIMRQDADGRSIGQNLGKGQNGSPERFWSRDEVLDKVGDLTAANISGGNVFVTPIDDNAYHVLIDDLDAPRLAEMRDEGYRPATVIESSPGSFQAVVKVDRRYPKDSVNEWFKDMNRSRGDEAITGLTHPFRLGGFENRKEKHKGTDNRYPFVAIREAVGTFCARAREVIHTYTLDAIRLADERKQEADRRDALAERGARRLGPRQ